MPPPPITRVTSSALKTWKRQKIAAFNGLGVLRMDVDDLGKLFAEGFPEETRSLTRLPPSALRYPCSLKATWERWLKNIPTKSIPFIPGGDDLFFVGCWSHIVELARETCLHLGIYASFHPAIHLSGRHGADWR